jgi:steroid delta-isomerase
MPAATATIRATIDEYVDRFNAGDPRQWAELFTEEARQEDPVGSPVNVGRDTIAAFYDSVAGAMGPPTLSLRDEPIIIGDEAIVLLTVVAGAGAERVRIPLIVDHMTFANDGRIASLRAFWDPAAMVSDPA